MPAIAGIFAGMARSYRQNIKDLSRCLILSPKLGCGTKIPLGFSISIVPQAVAQLTFGYNRLIIKKINDSSEAFWHAQSVVEHG